MTNVAGTKPALIWLVHISTVILVFAWLFPTLGLFVSSFRTNDQISASGWWRAPLPNMQNLINRTAPPEEQIEQGGLFVIDGELFPADSGIVVERWGVSSRAPQDFAPGDTTEFRSGGSVTIDASGRYRVEHTEALTGKRGKRLFTTARVPPDFTLDNYDKVLFDDSNVESMGEAFLYTLTVTIPATIIPIMVAAFAAYALAWMDFALRPILIAAIVGLLVVPYQLALIPLLKLHLNIGIGKGYLGVWLAHTGFGMPMAIYLLRNYMAGLPRDIIESARVDGATDFQIFTRMVVPLSYPALASFAIFQFLWTWNDLLVAKVFLIDSTGNTTVMTARMVELLGTRGGDWDVLATSAFVSIVVPLIVFFSLQRYLVRGLLAGSVK
ncbi:MAG: carbohydrate ABC transporter permease [Pseudomonadota bacterium]